MTLVKICGITNLEDALHAVKAGADSLGFNFYSESPRFVAPGVVRDILRKVRARHPEVKAVGVFVNENFSHACDIAVDSDIDALQLHGDESPNYAANLRSRLGLTVIKAFRVGVSFDTSTLNEYRVDAILFDGFSEKEFGGTGKRTDWGVASAIVRSGNRLYLAGGLSAENVAEAIRTVRPYAVDACSSLESTKGKKDPEKVRRFIENVRNYE